MTRELAPGERPLCFSDPTPEDEMRPPLRRLVTRYGLGEYWGCSEATIRRMDPPPPVAAWVGDKPRYDPAECDAWSLERGPQPTKVPAPKRAPAPPASALARAGLRLTGTK